MTWRMLDLFSGTGGFSLVAQWCWGDELEIVAFCEIDKFCQKVLQKHWPDVRIIEDVRDVTKKTLDDTKSGGCGFRETSDIGKIPRNVNSSCLSDSFQSIDLLTGGFPCQPFSVAGKRKGKEDNRFLWPEMFRVIKEIRPRWVVAENVAGIVRMELDNCLSDLEGEDYSTGTVIIPACAVNAPHRRDRVWIVAHAGGREWNQVQMDGSDGQEGCGKKKEDGGQSQTGFMQRRKWGFGIGGHGDHGESDNVAYTDHPKTTRQRKYGGDGLSVTETIQFEQSCQDVADDEKSFDGQYLARTNEGQVQKFGERDFARDVPNCIGKRLEVKQCQPKNDGTEQSAPERNGYSGTWWSTEPDVGRVAHGIPSRVDRLKSLGNAIVPQIAFQIFKAIKEIQNEMPNL